MAVNTLIQVRRGTYTEWNTANPTLAAGEIGYITTGTDAGKFKIGDGTTQWNSLGYAAVAPGDLTENIQDIIGTNVVAGSGISVSYNDTNGNTTISLQDPTIQVADITDLTATAAEINVLDGVTASTTELNYVDVTTAGVAQASKALILDASKNISGIYDLGIEHAITIGKTGSYNGQLSVKDLNGDTVFNFLGSEGGGSTLDTNAAVSFTNGTESTSTSTGALKVTGGVGVGGNLHVGGNLVVNGLTTTVNSTTVTIDDPIFTLGGDTAPGSDDSKDRGIEFKWHNGTVSKVGFFGFDDSTGKFTFIPDATNSSEVFSGTTGEIDAKIDWTNVNSKPDPVVTVTLTGEVTGTGSVTLTDLASGTATINTTISANSVALGTDTTGNYVASITNGSYITGGDGGSEGAALTLAVDATANNTASKVVARDASGNFSAGTITATLSGTATNANNIAITTNTTSATTYLTFVTGTGGNQAAYVNANLNFDAANNYLNGSSTTTPTITLRYFKIDGGTP